MLPCLAERETTPTDYVHGSPCGRNCSPISTDLDSFLIGRRPEILDPAGHDGSPSSPVSRLKHRLPCRCDIGFVSSSQDGALSLKDEREAPPSHFARCPDFELFTCSRMGIVA
ncbi:hypothetical protein NL676_024126 [Syzygium grande]|nr:hypothetical protein NL676_024126 [Syzygium grande]